MPGAPSTSLPESPQPTFASLHPCQFLFLRPYFAFSPPSLSLPFFCVSPRLSSSPLLSPPLSFLLFSTPPRPSARRRDGRTTTHYCTAAAAYAPRPTDRARAFGSSLRGSSRDHCLLQPPAGLGLLLGGLRASFPGHHGDHHFPGIPVLPGGPPPISHPQVPLLCFYILNWRFIFNIYYLRRALCCEGGPGVVSGVLPAWHPLPGSHPPRCLCASCLSPPVHSFRAFTVFPQAPPPHPSQLPPPTPMVSHSAGHPTSTLLSVLLFL